MRIHLALLVVLPIALTGCAIAPTANPVPEQGLSLQGKIHGGQQPVNGAHVYLMAANTTGYGGNGIAAGSLNASISLLSAAALPSDSVGKYVTTAPDGSFSITSDYTCTAGQQLYIYALGGNPGAGINSAAGFLAALGDCSTLTSSTYIWVNEVSTIAAAYAFAGFAADATHVSSSGTTLAQTGIANAFLNAANLATLKTGAALALTPAGNGTVPQTEINTLANILASCVNSSSSTSATCNTLFANAKSAGTTGTTATDTATAAINIAHNPAAAVAALYTIPLPTIAFAPTLPAQPTDFSVAVTYSGGGQSGPNYIAIDASGNAWISNTAGNSVTKLNSLGAALSGSSGYTSGGIGKPQGLAIDAAGNVWVPDGNPNSCVTKINNAGTTFTQYTSPDFNNPIGIAFDLSGNLWIPNYNGSNVVEMNTSGTVLLNLTGGSIFFPGGPVVDGDGNIWIGNSSSSLTVIKNGGSLNTSFSTGLSGNSHGLALDSGGDLWLVTFGNAVGKFSQTDVELGPSSGYSGAGLNGPYGIAIDGAGNVFISNNSGNNLTELSSTGSVLSPSAGYASTILNTPETVAIDGSGNVWIPNGNATTVLIGIAAPVITPIAAGLPSTANTNGTSNLGTRP